MGIIKSMKRKKVDGWWRYEVTDDLVNKMFVERERVVENTYSKPGKVAVALLTSSGNIYQGVSYHSDVYTLTMHAEMTALANAAIHGEKEIVAIIGPNCHICKQLLWESAVRSKIDSVILIKEDEKIKKVYLSEMMTYAWPDKEGDK